MDMDVDRRGSEVEIRISRYNVLLSNEVDTILVFSNLLDFFTSHLHRSTIIRSFGQLNFVYKN